MIGRLDELIDEKYECKNNGAPFVLMEKAAKGRMQYSVSCNSGSVLFKLDKSWTMGWLKNQKCADYAVFELNGSKLVVHIFELKKTINSGNWKKIKEQFMGAYLRIGAIAGVLEESVSEVRLYSCYVDDSLTENIIAKRTALSNPEIRKDFNSWEVPNIIFNYSAGDVTCTHTRILLDACGVGSYQL